MEDFAIQNKLLYINTIEIKNNTKPFPQKKTPGEDQITYLIIKKLPNKAI